MAKEKKVKEANPRPEKYEKSNLAIKGTFDEAMSVFFKKPENQDNEKGDTK